MKLTVSRLAVNVFGLLLVTLAPSLASLASAQHVHGSGLPHSIPDFCGTPTISSQGTGAWSNPATWAAGRVPGAGDRVQVTGGHTVTYDLVSDAAVHCVGVKGRLNFRTDLTTRLTVGTLMVMDGGFLWMGDATTPVAANVLAEIVIANVAITLASDPEQYGTGLLSFGKVSMHGAVRTPTFVRVAAEPRAGHTAVALSTGVQGWATSDRVVIPDTRHLRWNEAGTSYVPQWEVRNLSSTAGASVVLQSPLTYDHLGARDQSGVLEFLPHVGNLTRNIVVRSANPAGTRGHVLFTHRADIDIRYAAFKDLGRTTIAPLDSATFDAGGNVTHLGTNQIGRYSLHLHHLMGPAATPANGYQFTLIGNAVEGGTKWGITLHNTHFGLVQGNVIYNVDGASLMAEDGSESYNLIDGNFAVRGIGTGGRDGGGREGVGFYFRGPNNYVRNNVAANFMSDNPDAAYGYKYFQTYLDDIRVPNFRGADTSVTANVTVRDGNATAILEFTDNEVYGATEAGMTYWWVGTYGNNPRNAPQSVIRNLTVWHVFNKGIFNYPSSNIVIDGFIVRGKDPAGSACCALGFVGGDYLTDGLIIRRANIQGMKTGIMPSTANGRSVQIIEDSYLQNFENIRLDNQDTSSYRADEIGPRRVLIRNVRFARPPGPGSYAAIRTRYYDTPTRSLIQRDQLFVYDYDGVAGDSFQVYFREQAPGFVIPQSIWNPDGSPSLQASPVAGLTNAQNWATYGLAIAGEVAPCSTTRPDIEGFVCAVPLSFAGAMAGAPPIPTPPPPPPSAVPTTPPPSTPPVVPPSVPPSTPAAAPPSAPAPAPPVAPSTPPPTPTPAPPSGSSCATPDPFAAMGGGTCWAGGWLPPGMTPPGATAPVSASTPAPAAPAPSSPSPSTCTTPDPFAAMGGGACYAGGWLPPGMAPPAGSSAPVSPSPSAPPSGSAPTPSQAAPGPSTPSVCATPDPFAAMGGGTCYAGGWLPPGMTPPSVSPAPAPSQPVPTSPAGPTGTCVTPDPFVAIGGGRCVNGGWIPRGMTGGGN